MSRHIPPKNMTNSLSLIFKAQTFEKLFENQKQRIKIAKKIIWAAFEAEIECKCRQQKSRAGNFSSNTQVTAFKANF